MKPNIHPELYRAMQSAREADLSRATARQRSKADPERSGWVVRCARVAAFFDRALRDGVHVPPLAENPSLSE